MGQPIPKPVSIEGFDFMVIEHDWVYNFPLNKDGVIQMIAAFSEDQVGKRKNMRKCDVKNVINFKWFEDNSNKNKDETYAIVKTIHKFDIIIPYSTYEKFKEC